jgi:hypothetical protein
LLRNYLRSGSGSLAKFAAIKGYRIASDFLLALFFCEQLDYRLSVWFLGHTFWKTTVARNVQGSDEPILLASAHKSIRPSIGGCAGRNGQSEQF